MAGHDKLTPEGKRFLKEIAELKKLQVRVGFQRGFTDYDDNGVDMVDVAMWNELGTVNSPPRPFLRQSVDDNTFILTVACEESLKSIVQGQGTARDALQMLGVLQTALIQDKIRNGDFVPNAPSTIRKKKSSKPLIDSGLMRQSVRFIIKKKGK